MEKFGDILRRHRTARRLSLRQLGALVNFNFTHISQVECGTKRPSAQFAEVCDRALHANGALMTAYESQVGDQDMRRRTVLWSMSTLAAVSAAGPSERLEALRQMLNEAARVGHDEWEQIVADYGLGFYRLPREVLMDHLRSDLAVLHGLLAASTEPVRSRLLQAAARLSVIVALESTAAGQAMLTRRWWSTAHRLADESRDSETMVLTRAWETVNGCYDGRLPGQVVAISDQVMPLVAGEPTAATCGLLSGRAQAFSLAGRHTEAVALMQQVSDLTERLPDMVIADAESLWGWPEHRLRHAQSWIYSYAGDLTRADEAQNRAAQLYPGSQRRLRAQVELHRAACLIRTGHITDGLHMATSTLDGLPTEHHNELVRQVARFVIKAVPVAERKRPIFDELSQRLHA
ncbi:DNA-binding protein [Micromonospora rosaria]|uniref:DNA-binding protein n=1 Tax=Micromonospora rosaria TaxID=47874 RepID=A0A136PR41_9ACTN|nr:helix-turn-helix transcriptional regulator [Micromonospora rosaria]KXK60935.1 DNA-binding protein [Micromonospora rosaria]